MENGPHLERLWFETEGETTSLYIGIVENGELIERHLMDLPIGAKVDRKDYLELNGVDGDGYPEVWVKFRLGWWEYTRMMTMDQVLEKIWPGDPKFRNRYPAKKNIVAEQCLKDKEVAKSCREKPSDLEKTKRDFDEAALNLFNQGHDFGDIALAQPRVWHDIQNGCLGTNPTVDDIESYFRWFWITRAVLKEFFEGL